LFSSYQLLIQSGPLQ